MNTTFEQTETAYNIAIRSEAGDAIKALQSATGEQIRNVCMSVESNERLFLEVMKIVRAYGGILNSLLHTGGF